MTDFVVVIPARYAATRLPGKPLLDIHGQPLIQHVYERARQSGARQVIIATDDARIQNAAEKFGAMVVMTSAQHPSGTDRIAEVVRQQQFSDATLIVNLQGDEPLMPAAVIRQVAGLLDAHPLAGMATVCERITLIDDVFDPSIVKVVMDAEGRALAFSRAAIPHDRSWDSHPEKILSATQAHFRHVGLYAYRAGFVRRYATMPPCALEQCESLEQLRALYNGVTIMVAEACADTGFGVDTQADLNRVRELMTR